MATPHVRIETQHGVAFGQVIKVVGSTEALGNWEAAAAPSERPLCRLLCPWRRFRLPAWTAYAWSTWESTHSGQACPIAYLVSVLSLSFCVLLLSCVTLQRSNSYIYVFPLNCASSSRATATGPACTARCSDAAAQPRRARCAGMEWAEGNQWSLSLELAPGVYDFKLVTAVAETGEAVEWEAGDNRQLKVCCCEGNVYLFGRP